MCIDASAYMEEIIAVKPDNGYLAMLSLDENIPGRRDGIEIQCKSQVKIAVFYRQPRYPC